MYMKKIMAGVIFTLASLSAMAEMPRIYVVNSGASGSALTNIVYTAYFTNSENPSASVLSITGTYFGNILPGHAEMLALPSSIAAPYQYAYTTLSTVSALVSSGAQTYSFTKPCSTESTQNNTFMLTNFLYGNTVEVACQTLITRK
jgi:hypothetical protein